MRKLALLLSILTLGALGLVACDDDKNRPSDEEIITKTGNEWAAQFAKVGGETCSYYNGQPACEREECQRVGSIALMKNCTRPSSGFRRSFANATVERVVVEGRHATAEYSNGESVEFEAQKADEGDKQPAGQRWFVAERWVKKIGRTIDALATDDKSCGTVLRDHVPPFWLAVLAGDASCRAARRVMHDWAAERNTGPWSCISGPESHVVCEKVSGKTISAGF